MLSFTDPLFIKYANFVGQAEGGLSNNKNDSAAKYVQPGQYHTNKGVIWPTFRFYAKTLGVKPTYENFINLTKEQSNRILYEYYKLASNGIKDNKTGLILTNIYWGSGNVLGKHTRLALRKLNLPVKITGNFDQNIKKIINEQDSNKFNSALMDIRKDFLTGLTISEPKNKEFLNGWLKRENLFSKEFLEINRPNGNTITVLALLLTGFFLLKK